MMESFGLYEDLSLFSGDLLVGLNPLADELPYYGPDGSTQEFTKVQPQVDLFTDEPVNPDPANVQDDWMDKRMDIINLLSGANVQLITEEGLPSSDVTHASSIQIDFNSLLSQKAEPQYEALQPVKTEDTISREVLLQNVTEFLSSDLDDSTQNTSCDLPFSSLGEELVDFSGDGLACMLSEDDINALSAPILSPISPQDVESILSSGPPSPILSTMSPQDVELVLSSGPSSPDSMASVNDGVVPHIKTINRSFFLPEAEVTSETVVEIANEAPTKSSIGPVRSVRASRMKKYQPYKDYEADVEPKATPTSSRAYKSRDRVERKKQQNKDAALRYRQKKKQEQTGVFGECEQLEKTNEELNDKVDGMTREIQYLKDLLLEVYKAKGIQTPKGLLCK